MHWATSFLASSQFGVQASLFRNSSKLRSAKTEDLRHWHGFPSQAAGRSQSFRTIAFREAGPGNCQQSLPCTGQADEAQVDPAAPSVSKNDRSPHYDSLHWSRNWATDLQESVPSEYLAKAGLCESAEFVVAVNQCTCTRKP